jgi:hypothetical protein
VIVAVCQRCAVEVRGVELLKVVAAMREHFLTHTPIPECPEIRAVIHVDGEGCDHEHQSN